jgi:tight adherence protein B
MTALAAILGAGAGLGLVMIIGGCRRSDDGDYRRHVAFSRIRRDRFAINIAIAAGAMVLVGAVTRWPVAALLAGAGVLTIPKVLIGSKYRARQVARTEAIAGWTEMLRDTLSAAAGLEQAIAATAAVSPAPIRPEVIALATALESERLIPALRNFANDLADPTGDLVVAALVLAAGHEARKLTELLGSLAAAARDQASMQLRIDAGRARIRTSTNVVIGSTLFFALGLIVLNRSYLHPFGTALGQAILAIIGVIFGFSFWWLERMGRPHPPDRFLVPVSNSTPVQSTSQRGPSS